MYKVESNKAIGEYVHKLITRKYGPARQFAKWLRKSTT